MVKGHNKDSEHSRDKGQGQDEHLSHKERKRQSQEKKGRHPDDDQSDGTKGKNSI
jgi:hypothetical protein